MLGMVSPHPSIGLMKIIILFSIPPPLEASFISHTTMPMEEVSGASRTIIIQASAHTRSIGTADALLPSRPLCELESEILVLADMRKVLLDSWKLLLPQRKARARVEYTYYM